MRKTLTTIAIIAVLFVFTSSYNAYDVNTKVNSFAPNFSVSNSDNDKLLLSELRGDFVLVNFWSSQDATSRIKNIIYDKFIQNSKMPIRLVSINYDQSNLLYQEIIRHDNLNGSSQFHDKDGKNSEAYKRYHLETGFNSYLINREGKIIAINPTKLQLTEFICQ